jgi:hypothetical protein
MPTKDMTSKIFVGALLISILAVFSYSDELTQKAVRVEKGPAVDGSLDDAVWKLAAPFSGFKMVFPNPGSAPSEKTELRILYDEANLYIGVFCHDREPSKISANSMAHDASGDEDEMSDDTVKVLLDPFQDRRSAYIFFVNPRGARSEGLAFGQHFSLDWDGIWDAKSKIQPDGWSCEMKIPFKTISFKPGLASWGINIERNIPRKQETIRLSGTRRDSFFYNAVEAAPLEGIGGVKQGLGITFRPYGIVSGYKNHEAGSGTDWKPEGGFDLYKNFTPNFVGAFSYRTDFAETEVDERRINLTRFPLYFPEKRTFFLEGSEIFNFAGSSAGGGWPGDASFEPFFSRRIGLHESHQIPVVFGTKFFGKLGNTNLAFVDMMTDAYRSADLRLSKENFIAGRVSQNIFAESKIGLIFTSGSPTGESNSLAGFDLTYKTSRFMGNQNFSLTGWYVYNWNGIKTGKHQGFGLKMDYPNDLWDMNSSYAYYGDSLNPGLGFISRNNVQNFELGFSYQPRPKKGLLKDLVRQFFFELRFTFFWDLAGNLETREIFMAPLNLRTESGEHIEFNIMPNRDVLPYDFEVAEGVIIPKAAYNFTRYSLEFNSASHRPWMIGLNWTGGGFYSGTCNNIEIEASLKFKGYANLSLDANIVRGRLPRGNFNENVYQLKADFFLTPDLGLMNYIQYDDVSKRLGASIRFRWQIAPGNEIYLVYNKNWERRWNPESRFFPLEERGVFKITLSVRP